MERRRFTARQRGLPLTLALTLSNANAGVALLGNVDCRCGNARWLSDLSYEVKTRCEEVFGPRVTVEDFSARSTQAMLRRLLRPLMGIAE